jgi:hypothetical protein
MRGFLPLAAGRAGECAIRRLRSELSGVGRNDLLVVAQQVAPVDAPFTSSTPSAKPVAQCAFSGLSWRVPNIGSRVWSVTSIPD